LQTENRPLQSGANNQRQQGFMQLNASRRQAGLRIHRSPQSLESKMRANHRKTRPEKEKNAMPLFMDVHQHVEGLTAEAVSGAHQADLKTQEKYGVKYLRYWFDEGAGKVFCLIEAPSKEAADAVHREAHGLVADQIVEVQEGK
jgi:hypothetical protein